MAYLPAESDSGMFGGNSNWRGPIWMPVNALIIRALLQYYTYYGDRFTVECPTGSGQHDDAVPGRRGDVAPAVEHLPARRARAAGRCTAAPQKFQDDPHWRDLLLFYEYFHGDNGAGLGASHQTGWTGIVARMMHLFATVPAAELLRHGKAGVAKETDAAGAGARR